MKQIFFLLILCGLVYSCKIDTNSDCTQDCLTIRGNYVDQFGDGTADVSVYFNCGGRSIFHDDAYIRASEKTFGKGRFEFRFADSVIFNCYDPILRVNEGAEGKGSYYYNGSIDVDLGEYEIGDIIELDTLELYHFSKVRYLFSADENLRLFGTRLYVSLSEEDAYFGEEIKVRLNFTDNMYLYNEAIPYTKFGFTNLYNEIIFQFRRTEDGPIEEMREHLELVQGDVQEVLFHISQ